MKFTTQTPTEYKIHTITTITICIPANDDEIAPNAPMRKDDMWEIDINVDSKSVNNWPTGETMNLSACVADSGCYYLKTDTGEIITSLEEEYVPNKLLPGAYGDYLELDIDEYGTINNWLKDANFSDFQPEEITD